MHFEVDDSNTISIASSVAAFFALVIIVIVAVVVYRKCCRKNSVEVDVNVTTATKTLTEQTVKLFNFKNVIYACTYSCCHLKNAMAKSFLQKYSIAMLKKKYWYHLKKKQKKS